MKYQLVASPYPDGHLVVSPGQEGGIRIGASRYAELRDVAPAAPVPDWLTAAARAAWGLDAAGRAGDVIVVRPDTEYGYARASYELNLGCNYDCEHCYWAKRRSRVWSGPAANACSTSWRRPGSSGSSSLAASR